MTENIKPKKYISLKTKITISIVLFVNIVLGIILVTLYLNSLKTIKDDLSLRLINEVNIAVLQIDAEKHSQLKTIADEQTDNYKDIKSVLQKIRNNSTDIYYIYTMRENVKKEMTFVVDAEENPDKVSHIGDVYQDPNQFLINNFLTINKPVVEPGFSTDKSGTWISAYAPFYDKNNKRDGVLGIDIKASEIINNNIKVLIFYILTFLIAGLMSSLLGIYLSGNLIKSVNYLKEILNNNNNKHIESEELEEFSNDLKIKLSQSNLLQKESEEHILNKNKTLEKMNQLMVGRELEMIKLKKEINELKKVNEKSNDELVEQE